MPISEDLERIALQENVLQYATFDEAAAWSLGSRLYAMAIERRLGVVIDIRRAGQPLFYAALPGTSPDNAEWVRRKSNVTMRLHRSSYAVGLETEAKQSTLLDRYAMPVSDYAGHGGCFPIRVAGSGVVAAVTVSGLPQRADHELVIEAICAELGQDYSDLRLPD
jgi:uncharacterized protein (UPF0303 family)